MKWIQFEYGIYWSVVQYNNVQEKDKIGRKGARLPGGYIALLPDGYITSIQYNTLGLKYCQSTGEGLLASFKGYLWYQIIKEWFWKKKKVAGKKRLAIRK